MRAHTEGGQLPRSTLLVEQPTRSIPLPHPPGGEASGGDLVETGQIMIEG